MSKLELMNQLDAELHQVCDNFDKDNLICYRLLLVKLYNIALILEDNSDEIGKYEKSPTLSWFQGFLKTNDLYQGITIEDLTFLFNSQEALNIENKKTYICLINMLSVNLISSDESILSYSMKEFINAFIKSINDSMTTNIDNVETSNVPNDPEAEVNNETKIEIKHPEEPARPSTNTNINNNYPIIENNQNYIMNREYLKEYLIRKNLLRYKCNRCGLSDWQNNPLILSIHSKTGIYSLNHIEDLEFLCPNCYSQMGE